VNGPFSTLNNPKLLVWIPLGLAVAATGRLRGVAGELAAAILGFVWPALFFFIILPEGWLAGFTSGLRRGLRLVFFALVFSAMF
jgi:hypothetical protein